MMKNAMRGLLASAVAGVMLTAGPSHAGAAVAVTTDVAQGTVIENVTVVDMSDSSLRSGMNLVLDGGKIARIAVAGAIRAGAGMRRIDASGKYVVPGYLDMHKHSMVAADSQSTYWPLLITNGVTGIREMAGAAALI